MSLRSAVAPVAVTWRRVRARPERTLLVSLGVAVAVAFLVAVAGGSAVSQDVALRRALAALPPAERVLRVGWSGQVATGGYGPLDRAARRELGSLTAEPVTASVELADVRLGTGLVKLGAADRLGAAIHLHAGRLPRGCDASRCEVVQIAGTPVTRIDDAGVHLRVVGRGALTSLVPFGQGGLATAPMSGGERPEPVLLTRGVAGLAGLAPLLEFNRNYTWSAALAPQSVHDWNLGALFAAEGRAQARLSAANELFALDAPDDALAASKQRGETAARRVLLVGTSAALLLLAFAGVTAGALRRDARAELRRLTTRGATRGQQRGFLLAESVAAVVPGTILGVALGIVVALLIARRSTVSAGAAIEHGLVTARGLALVAGGAVGALVAVLFALRAQERARRRGIRPADMAALGALLALALLLLRGQSSSGPLDRGSAVALAATPLLASFAFCVLLARVLEPLTRVALRTAREGPRGLFLALFTLQRSPARTAGIVGFLAVATALASFALSYRATLNASTAARAAYAVPLDYTLQTGPALVAPRDVASLREYRALAPGVGAWPILRRVAEVPGTGATPATPTVLGIPASAFPLLHGWRSDFSAVSPSTLGRLLAPNTAVALRGAPIPRDATALDLPARAQGAAVQPVFVVLAPDGSADQLLPPLATQRSRLLSVAVPAADRGGRIVALGLDLPSAVQRSAAHQEAEGRNGATGFTGTLRLGPLVAQRPGGDVVVSDFAGWVGGAGVTPANAAGGVRIAYSIDTSEQALLRPRQPFDSRLLPVVASPDVAKAAGPDGSLELNFGDAVVPARLVAVVRRFPTTQDSGESFVVADEGSLASALGTRDLPASIPDELWLSAPPRSAVRLGAVLAEPPYSSLDVASRAAIRSGLRADPIARGIVIALLAAAAAAVVLALVGLALVTASFLRDDGDTLFDLETQGVGPSVLRSTVRWRAVGLAAVGLPAGLALGAAMVAITGKLLAADATLTLPDPPLRSVTPWLTLAAAAGVLAVAAWLLIELVLRAAHRRGVAGRGQTGESWAA
jgi:hypothetical protein